MHRERFHPARAETLARFSRRRFVTLAGGVGLAAASHSGANTVPAPKPAAAIVDSAHSPRDPATSMRQFMRLFATTGGEVCATCEGIICGREPGDVARRLIGWRSVPIIRVAEVSRDSFASEQREAMTYADLDTGEPVTEFLSPYTDEKLIPIGYVSPHNRYFFDANSAYQRREAGRPERGPIPDWRTDGIDVWVAESRFNSLRC